MDMFTNLKPGDGTMAAYQTVRKAVSHMDRDRVLATDIETVRDLLRSGGLITEIEKVVGELG